MAFLIIADAGPQGEQFPLNSATVVLGRHPDCDVVVDVGAVSRHHAQITRRDEGHWIEDLHSRNGTFLNGQLINKPTLLTPGDRVRICDVEFEYRDGDHPSSRLVSTSKLAFGGSSFGVVMVDDIPSEANSPVSKVEVRKTGSGVHVAATLETKLTALLQITQSLGNALSLDEVLPKVLETLFNIFPQADRGLIVLEEEGEVLVPRWAKTRRQQAETETLRISRTIIRQAMSERSAILSFDASNDARFRSSESIADFRIRSLICAPLINGEGAAIGALQIDTTDQRNRFEEQDVEVLAAVATQAGIAIHNAQLHEQALQQQAVEHDLKLAKEVQAAFLPQRDPEIPGFRFYSYYAAAHHIGGDYFDYIRLPGNRLGVVVADVVGHGVAAAMFMAKLSAETRFCLASEADPAVAVSRLNDRMSDLELERFVTFLLLVLDPADASAVIVNAGHMPPIIRRADRGAESGRVEEPSAEEAGMPIAIMPEIDYEAVRIELRPGDLVAMYTDGLNEAMNAVGDTFGIQRIRYLVGQGGSGKRVADRIVRAVRGHTAGVPADDDQCIVVIERVEAVGAGEANVAVAANAPEPSAGAQ